MIGRIPVRTFGILVISCPCVVKYRSHSLYNTVSARGERGKERGRGAAGTRERGEGRGGEGRGERGEGRIILLNCQCALSKVAY